MKAGTTELLKFTKLQRRLKDSKRGTIGLLEGLWLAVAKNCPLGDIGKFTNEEIAIMVDWDGDPEELVSALVDCKWIDHSDEYRLIVHDWSDHCPTYVKGNIAKYKKSFVSNPPNEPPKDGAKEPPKDTPNEPPSEPPTKPSQSKPILSQPSLGFVGCSLAEDLEIPTGLNTPEFIEAWQSWCDWHFLKTGSKLDAIKGRLQLGDLLRLGVQKAIADIEVTIKRANHPGALWDSSRDHQGKIQSEPVYEKLTPRVRTKTA